MVGLITWIQIKLLNPLLFVMLLLGQIPYKLYVYYVQQVQQNPLQTVSLFVAKKQLYKYAKLVYYMRMLNITQQQNKMQNTNTNTKQNTTRKLTKAQLMREQIALVKQANCASVAQQQAYVVDWMCNTLAFKKQLARVYVKENWHKVIV